MRRVAQTSVLAAALSLAWLAGAQPKESPPIEPAPREETTPEGEAAPDENAPEQQAPEQQAPEPPPAPTPPPAEPPPPAAPPPPTAPPRTTTPAPPPQPSSSGETDSRIVFGGIALAVGGAAVVAGSVVGIVAAAKYADLDCPNDVCRGDQLEEADDYNALRVPSGATIAAGGLVAFIGGVFLINGMNDEDSAVAVRVSPVSATLMVSF